MITLRRMLFIVALLFTSQMYVGCSEDPIEDPDSEHKDPDEDNNENTDKGLYSVKSPNMEIGNIGGEVTVTFLSMGDWSVESDSKWCTPSVTSGDRGDVVLVINVDPNADDSIGRTAKLTIDIEGYMDNVDLCEVRQALDVEDQYTSGTDANQWIHKYMSSHYLWNYEYFKVLPSMNFWTDSNSFLNTALNRMEGIDEDGKYYANGERYFYSKLTTYMYTQGYSSPLTRGAAKAMSTAENYGIQMVYPVSVGSNYYFLVASVIDESPAFNAGIKRGMYITKYNKAYITNSNLEEAYNALMGYTESETMLTLSMAEYIENAGGKYDLVETGDINVTPTLYTKNPIIYKGVFQNSKLNKNVGYLVYSEFDMNADDYLVDVFESFKKNNVTDLILDLRYNGGGDVYSSAVMATAITGAKDKGEIYCEMEYNEYRRAKGKVDYFYIGEDPSMVEYPAISDALATSLNLDCVYVITTGFTASASELIINGLRGVGVEVVIIGETTEGKNVGMEVINSASPEYSEYDFGEYVYEFAPITFYNRNAQGFKSFSDGFTPDCETVETNYIMFDWGINDYSVNNALSQIYDGLWLSAPSKVNGAVKPTEVLPIAKNTGLRPIGRGSRVYVTE